MNITPIQSLSEDINVISPVFKDQGKDGKFKIISFYAKSQRLYGVMVN